MSEYVLHEDLVDDFGMTRDLYDVPFVLLLKTGVSVARSCRCVPSCTLFVPQESKTYTSYPITLFPNSTLSEVGGRFLHRRSSFSYS